MTTASNGPWGPFGNCTARRIVKETHSTLNMATGKETKGRIKIVTKACGTPLFGGPESWTGICRSCTGGWEVRDNRFASAKERERVTGRKGKA